MFRSIESQPRSDIFTGAPRPPISWQVLEEQRNYINHLRLYFEAFGGISSQEIAEEFTHDLIHVEGSYDLPDHELSRSFNDRLRRLYARALSSIAMAQLLQVPSVKERTVDVPESSRYPNVFIDFGAVPFKVHAKEQSAAEILAQEMPLTKWYEGESIYVQVLRPSQPSKRMRESSQEVFGRSYYATADTVSLVPRAKLSYLHG